MVNHSNLEAGEVWYLCIENNLTYLAANYFSINQLTDLLFQFEASLPLRSGWLGFL